MPHVYPCADDFPNHKKGIPLSCWNFRSLFGIEWRSKSNLCWLTFFSDSTTISSVKPPPFLMMTLFGYLCQECDKTYEPVDSEAPCTTFVEDYCLFLALILNGAIAYHKCDDLLTYTWQRARTVWSVAVRNVLIRCLSLSLSHTWYLCASSMYWKHKPSIFSSGQRLETMRM